MSKKSKKACIGLNCVACGCCVKVCPLQALSIVHGTTAKVDTGRCVGCGKCENACPGGVITIQEVSKR